MASHPKGRSKNYHRHLLQTFLQPTCQNANFKSWSVAVGANSIKTADNGC